MSNTDIPYKNYMQDAYNELAPEAALKMFKRVLRDTQKAGELPGEHHFYITFLTQGEGVKISEYLLDQYPLEMTIVVQHQFWDLEVHDEHFEIVLKFSGIPQHLHIPYHTITRFADPHANAVFDLPAAHFEDEETLQDAEAELEGETDEAQADTSSGNLASGGGTVVSLDQFRRR